jgi:hypothetical protein
LLMLLVAATAAAQPAATPGLAVGFGGGVGTAAVHDNSGGVAWQGTVHARPRRHVILELGVGMLRTVTRRVDVDVPIQTPGGPVFVDLDSETRERSTWLEFNVLATHVIGRVRLWGGGGPGVQIYSRERLRSSSGCPPVAGLVCQPFAVPFSSMGIRVQGTGGADVALAERVAVFAQARFGIYGGYVDRTLTVGMRLAIRP